MPRSLAKVHKQITKKRGNTNGLHENSRNSQKLRRAGARDDKLARELAGRQRNNKPLEKRVEFFQEALHESAAPKSVEEICDLVTRWIHRSNDELTKIQQERRPGRAKSTREDHLTDRIAREEKEFDIGFYIPDVQNERNIERIRGWSGAWSSLTAIEFVRINRDGEIQPATFPPKGLS